MGGEPGLQEPLETQPEGVGVLGMFLVELLGGHRAPLLDASEGFGDESLDLVRFVAIHGRARYAYTSGNG